MRGKASGGMLVEVRSRRQRSHPPPRPLPASRLRLGAVRGHRPHRGRRERLGAPEDRLQRIEGSPLGRASLPLAPLTLDVAPVAVSGPIPAGDSRGRARRPGPRPLRLVAHVRHGHRARRPAVPAGALPPARGQRPPPRRLRHRVHARSVRVRLPRASCERHPPFLVPTPRARSPSPQRAEAHLPGLLPLRAGHVRAVPAGRAQPHRPVRGRPQCVAAGECEGGHSTLSAWLWWDAVVLTRRALCCCGRRPVQPPVLRGAGGAAGARGAPPVPGRRGHQDGGRGHGCIRRRASQRVRASPPPRSPPSSSRFLPSVQGGDVPRHRHATALPQAPQPDGGPGRVGCLGGARRRRPPRAPPPHPPCSTASQTHLRMLHNSISRHDARLVAMRDIAVVALRRKCAWLPFPARICVPPPPWWSFSPHSRSCALLPDIPPMMDTSQDLIVVYYGPQMRWYRPEGTSKGSSAPHCRL